MFLSRWNEISGDFRFHRFLTGRPTTTEDDAKPEETHQGATLGNRKLSFSFSPY